MLNKNFIIEEGYDNVPNKTELSCIMNRFSPKLFIDNFSLYTSNTADSLSKEFYTCNHVVIVATNNTEKIIEYKSKYENLVCEEESIVYNKDNILKIYKCETVCNGIPHILFLIYICNYYIKKQAFVYAKTQN